jgi:hypothetical protein
MFGVNTLIEIEIKSDQCNLGYFVSSMTIQIKIVYCKKLGGYLVIF